MGGYGQSITHCLCCSFLLSGRTPHTLPLLQRGSFPGVQLFRNRLLQRGSPAGSQALPANLLWHGLLSPQVRRSRQEPAPVRALHRVTASFRHPPALVWGPPRAAAGALLHCGPLWAARGCSLPHHGLHHEPQRNLSSGAWSTSSPFFFTDLGVCRVFSLT